MARAILSLNAGSSSIKFALFEVGANDALTSALRGQLGGIGTQPKLAVRDDAGKTIADEEWPQSGDHGALLGRLLDWVDRHLGGASPIAAGHRIVHGGPDHARPVRVDAALIDALERLTPLAPLHQPDNVAALRAIARARPDLPQIACFDTGFHRTMPQVATRFALPRAFEEDGIRRYGFHGLSYEYISRRLKETEPALASGRILVAHLGSGASLCALRDGRSIDTTMGLTPLDGLMMGTRCGALDPGIVLYLLQSRGMSPKEVEDLLYHHSGLAGVSGIGSDMRDLLACGAEQARSAVDLFVYRIAREAGGLVSSLGGLDGLVFTGGIGEHAPPIREAVCRRLSWLGIALDAAANERADTMIGTTDSRVAVRVIPTDEEITIARHVLETMSLGE